MCYHKTTLLFFFSWLLGIGGAFAGTIDTPAKQAFMIDTATHAVLLNKDGDTPMHPSSISKLMTSYILFQRLKEGRVKLDDSFTVSEKAWKTQGSKTFVHVGDQIKIEDLLKGIVIQSGNDACIVVAEGISGSEEAFVEEMNRVAKEMGLSASRFVNATGWPDDNHLMSARDLATLSERLIADFPEYYHYYALRDFTFNKITQQNRNRLLGNDIGVDGLKTGHTEAAGYGIALSAKKGDRRLILVINGLESDNQRVEEGDKLLRWGLREFENKTVLKQGAAVAEAPVWFGTSETVALVAGNDITLTLPMNAKNDVRFTLKYIEPIPAPIEQGAHVADMEIEVPGQPMYKISLQAATNVEKLSGFGHLRAVLGYYLLGRQQPQ